MLTAPGNWKPSTMSILFNLRVSIVSNSILSTLKVLNYWEIGALDRLLSMARRVLATFQTFIAEVWPLLETCTDLIQLIQCHGSLILPVPSELSY